jgi:hypothetical protein
VSTWVRAFPETGIQNEDITNNNCAVLMKKKYAFLVSRSQPQKSATHENNNVFINYTMPYDPVIRDF